MGDDPEPVPPDLTPDGLAVRLGGGFPGIPPGYVAFKGWLGPENGGIHRVFTNDRFTSFIEVHKDDIVAQVDFPREERDSRSLFYIERWANVIRGEAGYAHEMADEVWGPDPAGGGVPPHRPPYR